MSNARSTFRNLANATTVVTDLGTVKLRQPVGYYRGMGIDTYFSEVFTPDQQAMVQEYFHTITEGECSLEPQPDWGMGGNPAATLLVLATNRDMTTPQPAPSTTFVAAALEGAAAMVYCLAAFDCR